MRYGKRIKFGKRVKFKRGFHIIIRKKGKVVIGDNAYFNNNCTITCLGEIIIGSNNIFGEYVTLYDHNHVFNKKVFNPKELTAGKIIIGNDNWICSKVNICSNSVIGNRCVIAACTNYNNKIGEDYILYSQGMNKKTNIVLKDNM